MSNSNEQQQLDLQDESELNPFKPYNPAAQSRREYTQEDDERIMEAIAFAEKEGIPFEAVFEKLADELDRTARAVNVRYYSKLKPRNKPDGDEDADQEDEDNEGSPLGGGLMSRLKSLIRERDSYKARYEGVKKDYDKLMKEIKQIRNLLK